MSSVIAAKHMLSTNHLKMGYKGQIANHIPTPVIMVAGNSINFLFGRLLQLSAEYCNTSTYTVVWSVLGYPLALSRL